MGILVGLRDLKALGFLDGDDAGASVLVVGFRVGDDGGGTDGLNEGVNFSFDGRGVGLTDTGAPVGAAEIK